MYILTKILRHKNLRICGILPYKNTYLYSSDDKVKNQLPDYEKTVTECPTITSSGGMPLSKTTSSMTVGVKGPIVLQDAQFLDDLGHLVRERIPERVVHAKGTGAFGMFEVTKEDITKFCAAKLFSQCGKKTNVAVRFSTVVGETGSADTVRDVRGFAVKFYTEEGNWDLVGNNFPVFFINDPILFPHLTHATKRNPQTNCLDMNMFWDFMSLRKESIHAILMMFSERGIPDGFRYMNGHAVNTFKIINCDSNAFYCKFHFKPECVRNLKQCDADKLAGTDPDYAVRDLYNAIEGKTFPTWTMLVQTMPVDESSCCPFDPFDVTKTWPHTKYPPMEIGKLTLNQNPVNNFAQIQQLAFSVANMVPGVTPSPDKMLQGRIFAYSDAQRYRLGVNFTQLPVNKSYCVNTYQRDGAATFENQKNAPNYFPNSFKGPTNDISHKHLFSPHGAAGCVDKFESFKTDHFSQPKALYQNVLNEEGKESLITNLIASLKGASTNIQCKMLEVLKEVDCDLAEKVKCGLQPY